MALIQFKCIDTNNCKMLTKGKVYVGKPLQKEYLIYDDTGYKANYAPFQFEIVGK